MERFKDRAPEVGDVVMLASDTNMPMTIENITKEVVHTLWFDKAGHCQRGNFPTATLLVDDDDSQVD